MTILGTGRIGFEFFEDSERREAFIGAHAEAALVAEWLPLRANLSVLEHRAVPQFRLGLSFDDAAGLALRLLGRVGYAACAYRRDPDLGRERFIAKLVRAVLQAAPIILVDRPGLQLPDTAPAPFLDRVLTPLQDEFARCLIVDYAWNAPLYVPRESGTSG